MANKMVRALNLKGKSFKLESSRPDQATVDVKTGIAEYDERIVKTYPSIFKIVDDVPDDGKDTGDDGKGNMDNVFDKSETLKKKEKKKKEK